MPIRRYFLRIEEEDEHWRPKTREDCANVARPCPYVGCKWNLYLDVTITGGIKLNFPDREPSDMCESCVLDIAEAGGLNGAQVSEVMNLSRERIRQIESEAMVQMLFNANFMGVDLQGLVKEKNE